MLQSFSPDVHREAGGGKTNISLLEITEEWDLGSKTSTRTDRTQKFGEMEVDRNKTHHDRIVKDKGNLYQQFIIRVSPFLLTQRLKLNFLAS